MKEQIDECKSTGKNDLGMYNVLDWLPGLAAVCGWIGFVIAK